jgi:hypothetical protein
VGRKGTTRRLAGQRVSHVDDAGLAAMANIKISWVSGNLNVEFGRAHTIELKR